MKTIVVYYSHTGNTKKVSDVLSRELSSRGEVNTLRLEALDESNSFFFQAGRALFRKKAKISQADSDLSKYDLICLGTPVWAFGPAPAMNTYLDSCTGAKGKRIVLFATCGSGAGVGRCFSYMRKLLSSKGASSFRELLVQESKVDQNEFVTKAIGESLKEQTN